MTLLAIDPGSEQSAWVVWDGLAILAHGIEANADLLVRLGNRVPADHLFVEMFAGYGMAVGRSVFEACMWVGRFVQAWEPRPWSLVYRKDVKIHLCGHTSAKDPHVHEALVDRVGPKGTKKAPGPTFGIVSDEWSALAVAVYSYDRMQQQRAPILEDADDFA